MTILVTGANGTVGHQVVEQLTKRGANVRALVRDLAKANFPAGVPIVQGDLLDVDSLREAFTGVSTLFLLNAVVPDEFTQALIALNVAREAGVERIVYLSVIHSDIYVNVPHFAGKFGVERTIEQMGFDATILRPAYFMNNDLPIKDVVLGYGVYPMPIGGKGLAIIDRRPRHRRDRGHRAHPLRSGRRAARARPDQSCWSRHADRRGCRGDMVGGAGPHNCLSRR
jgi:uncharacterized protein YbjT (DUF2867 family)